MIYTKKFYSYKSLLSLKCKIHPNRIVKEYNYKESSGKDVFVIKYYRNTKALRKEHGF